MIVLFLTLMTAFSAQSQPTVSPFGSDYYGASGSQIPDEYPAPVVDTGLTVLGHWMWGSAYAIEMTGHYALVGQGWDYQVLDISDASHPQLIYDTTLMFGTVRHIKIIDTVMFMLVGNKVLFCDARQLYPLKEYGWYIDAKPVGFRDMSVSDSLMYLTTDLGMVVVNISDLTHPVFRGGVGLSYWRDHIPVAAMGQYVYCGPQRPGRPTFVVFRWTPDSAFGQVYKDIDVGGLAESILRNHRSIHEDISPDTSRYSSDQRDGA